MLGRQPRRLNEMMKEVTLAFLETLRQTQVLPPAAMHAHQRELLDPLVRHARAHVPFYRDSGRLDVLFRSDGTIDWERWAEIPLLKRSEVQQAGVSMHSVALPAAHGGTSMLTTSGSTGEPVRIMHSQLADHLVWPVVMLRSLEWYGVDPTRRFARIGTFPREDPPLLGPRLRNAWYPQFEQIELLGERLDLPESLGPSSIADELIAFRPICLSVNPVQLELLTAWDERRRLRDLGAITVMTSADRLSTSTKQTIEHDYGWKALNIYASNECGLMATACPHCDRFHIHAETTLIEVLNDDGHAASGGQQGWIVATPLYNYAMPLIRYDHADQTDVKPGPACRITLPSLDTVLGKEPVIFVFSGGVRVRPVLPASQVIEHLGAQAFQVAQVADDRCEFRIVPGTIEPEAMNFEAMTRLLRAKWWPDINVDYRIIDRLPGSGGRRKTAFFVREVAADDDRATANRPEES
jgi:phenylacetate-CoA ligase